MRQMWPAALISKSHRRILEVLFLEPNKPWYRSELARKLGVRPSTIQRPLTGLVDAGVLDARPDGNRLYYEVNLQSPIYAELRGLVVKTSGLVQVVADALGRLAEEIDLAFIYGSVARGEENASSDVDLLLVGSIGLAALALPLREARERLGREVNASVYAPAEFAKKARDKKHFVSRVLDNPRLFVVGTEDDLGRLTDAEAGRAGTDQQG